MAGRIRPPLLRLLAARQGRRRPPRFRAAARTEGRRAMDWKLELVPIPVSDVERSKRFYSEQVGFAVDHDMRVGEEVRIVQLTPPGSGCSIVIGAGTASRRPSPGRCRGCSWWCPTSRRPARSWSHDGVAAGPVQHLEDGTMAEGHGEPWNSFVLLQRPGRQRLGGPGAARRSTEAWGRLLGSADDDGSGKVSADVPRRASGGDRAGDGPWPGRGRPVQLRDPA